MSHFLSFISKLHTARPGSSQPLEKGASKKSLKNQALDDLQIAGIAFDHSREGMIITDAELGIISINRAFTLLTGYAIEDLRGKNPSVMGSDRQPTEFYTSLWNELRTHGYWQGEIWNRKKDGVLYPSNLQIVEVADEHGKISNYVAIYADISAKKSDEHKIRFLAYHDVLTHLPNRIALKEAFTQALSKRDLQRNHVGLIFLDLDRFKEVNDSLGHSAGDELLIKLTARVRECLRDCDTLSRLGGDEFIVLAPELYSRSDALRIASRIQAAMARPFELLGRMLHMSFSIGISVYPEDGANFEALLQRADTAMYAAKSAGRNTVKRFENWMHARNVEGMELRNKLFQALQQKQLVLHYQPQMDLKTNRIIGIEALARWPLNDGTMIPPTLFIPVAEESGLIVQLGEWVIRQACEDLSYMSGEWPDLNIAINVSSVQLRRPDFFDVLRGALARTGADPYCLELELTESTLLIEEGDVLPMISDIQRLGVNISIDDFGTGYSNLKQLSRLSANRLKIDRSFILGLPQDKESVTLTEAILHMSQGLGLRSVAEGVETREQLDFLKKAGCQEIQGYWLAKPQPLKDLAVWLRNFEREHINSENNAPLIQDLSILRAQKPSDA